MSDLGQSGDWRVTRFEQVRKYLPTITRDQFHALASVVGLWFQLKAESESRWTDEQRVALRQLDPDVWHSALLVRMLVEQKPPLPEPPPLEHAYPVYPEEA